MALFTALTLQILWEWFVVPLNIPPIGLAHAYGLVMIVSLLVYRFDIATKEDQGIVTDLIGRFVFNAATIAIGAITHYFMVS